VSKSTLAKAGNQMPSPLYAIHTTKIKIDHKLAESILDRLGYTLEDLSLKYGDVVISSGDISHHLYYGSVWSTANLMGYVNIENGIYYANPDSNHHTAELAALELLDERLVQSTAIKIVEERQSSPDYF
jgi:hypothetical protein